MHWTLQFVELALEIQGRVCSRCNGFKSLSEFYKQGNRYESLCKPCKKDSRKKRDESAEEETTESDSSIDWQETKSVSLAASKKDDREVMPVYDASIFYPAEARRALGISDEDMDSVVAFFRWHIEQREKRLKKKEK
jgi:hypothetical protein